MQKAIHYFLVSLFLVACSGQEIEALPSHDVLNRTVEVSSALESVAFSTDLTFSYQDVLSMMIDGSFKASGRMHHAGQQMYALLDGTIGLSQGPVKTPIDVQMEIVNASHDEQYMKLLSLYVGNDQKLFAPSYFEDLVGTWWRLSSTDADKTASLGSNPIILRTQASLIAFEKDYGIVRKKGRPLYHYAIRLDPEKVSTFIAGAHPDVETTSLVTMLRNANATGEVWIDAESFHLQRIKWELQPFETPEGQRVSLDIDIEFSDFNEAEGIEIPQEAEVLPGFLSSGSSESFSSGEEREIIDDEALSEDEKETTGSGSVTDLHE